MMQRRIPREYGPGLPPPRRTRVRNDRPARPVRDGNGIPAISPDRYSWLDGRAKPGPSQRDFDALQSRSITPVRRNLGLSVEEAYNLAETALKGHVRAKIECFNQKPPGTATLRFKQKLPFQVFNELDREFFRSVLKGNVSLGWSNLAPGNYSRTICANRRGNSRIRIELSTSLMHYGRRREILAALVHQMAHAYYLQCCGYRDQGYSGTGHGLEHEQPFLALLKLIGEHCEPLRGHLAQPLWAPERGNRGHDGFHPTAGASACYGHIDHYNDVDIQEWRDTAKATAESLQETQPSNKAGSWKIDSSFPRNLYLISRDGIESPPIPVKDWQYPREAYVFLSFGHRYYPIARSSVADLGVLTASPCFKGKVWLEFPQGTSEAEFLAFYLFLAHGVFPPSFKNLNTAMASSGLNNEGPPKIKPYDVSATTHAASLITAFKLGKALRYAPFCEFVLKGLRSLRATAENPMVVLEKIYSSQKTFDQSTASTMTGAPDSQLREWARAWLAVVLRSAEMGQHEAVYQTNIGVLRYHPEWSAKYKQLKASSQPLREDDEAAGHMILIKNGGDSRLLQQGMPGPAQQAPAPADFQQYLPLQHQFDIPRPIPLSNNFVPSNNLVPRPQNGVLPYHPGRVNEDSEIAALLEKMRLHEYAPKVADRSTPASDLSSYSASLQNHEALQLLREQALRERLGRPEAPHYQQGFPELWYPPGNNQFQGN
ncbi:MAG: hypothetical protein Q9216_006290 [Gyalolechia sp. 2 TL-2023]